MLKKYIVNTVLHTKLNTTNICNLTVLGNALKSLWLSSNRIVAVSIAQFLNLLHHPQFSISPYYYLKNFLNLSILVDNGPYTLSIKSICLVRRLSKSSSLSFSCFISFKKTFLLSAIAFFIMSTSLVILNIFNQS